jgi:regulator of sigma D
MTAIKINGKEYKVYYSYGATVKNDLIRKLAELGNNGDDQLSAVEKILKIVPEMFLIGLQKFHADEYGFDADNAAEKKQALNKVYALLDEYFEQEDADVQALFGSLQTELMENGFLSKLFKEEQKKVKAKNKKQLEVVEN